MGWRPVCNSRSLHVEATGTVLPHVVIELAVDHDLAAWVSDEPQHRHGSTQPAELLALVAQALEIVFHQREAPAVNARRIGFRLCFIEKGECGVGLVLLLLHRLPVCFAVVEEGIHLGFSRPVEQAHIFAELRVHVLSRTAPIHALREIDEEVIETHAGLLEVLPHAEPDVLTLRDAFGRVDARTHRVRRKRGQIPAAVGEGIVLEDDDGIGGFREPAFAQLATLLLFLGLVIHGPSSADDGDDDIRLQPGDLQRRQRVGAIGRVEDLLVGMCPAHLFGDAIDEIPDVVGQEAALVAFRGILAFTELAVADGGVGIGRHHGNHLHLVMIKLHPHVAHGLLEEFFVGVAELVERLAGLVLAFASVEREPVGMLREDLIAMRHVIHAMRALHAIRIAAAESHRPHGEIQAMHAETHVHAADRKVGPHRLVDLRQRDRLHRRHHFAKLARRIPAHPELHKKAANGIERTAFVEGPQPKRREFLPGLALVIRQTGVARQREAVLIHQETRHAPQRTSDLVPLVLGRAFHDLRVALRPRLDRRELRVLTDEREPAVA